MFTYDDYILDTPKYLSFSGSISIQNSGLKILFLPKIPSIPPISKW